VSRNVLVVTTVAPDGDGLRERLGDEIGADANVRVVAPAARIGKLDWLTNAEDDARSQAADAADRTASALPGDVTIDRTGQDTEAAQAIDDALRNFPADEIVVVTAPGEEATWLEDDTVRATVERSGVPVRRVELPPPG
jgi:hypothetical protein